MEINDLAQPSGLALGSAARATPALDHATLAALGAQVQGPVLLPGDDGYDAERSGFQSARRPGPP
ncbi:hypothetical protein [Streptomyces sp. NPDC058773]|uniref:hypothetical protein n=1 Tax=Streptomyces sp. NPDC058773 TaxID=3346632 RepID=UPI0036B15FED